MRKNIGKIIVAAFLLVLAFSCQRDKSELIPRKKMARIYADMFVMDQWILDNVEHRKTADTTWVYEPIFEKYGYTSKDYNYSMEYYIQDPDKYARILRETNRQLEDHLKHLKKEKKLRISLEEKKRQMEKYRTAYELFYERIDSPDSLERNDSVVYYLDSLSILVFGYNPEQRFDTLYIGPELRFPPDSFAQVKARRDSIARVDSIARADSIAKADSIARLDSIARRDSIKKSKLKANIKNLNDPKNLPERPERPVRKRKTETKPEAER